MNSHSLAKSTPLGRWTMVQRVLIMHWPVAEVARAAAVTVRTVFTWLRRFRQEGFLGLYDRSSRPHRSPHRLSPVQVAAIETVRRLKWVADEIAATLLLARSTVCLWLKRLGLARLKDLEPREPVVRYEAAAPGDLLHLDVKKLRGFQHAGRKFIEAGGRRWRGAPRQYLHVCIDDHSRLAFAQIHEHEDTQISLRFLAAALEFFAQHGIKAKRILTDNGSAYRSLETARAMRQLGLKHSFTRVRRPQTNGKAERFIRTSMERWGYKRFENSAQRDAALPAWLDLYNYSRPHRSLGGNPPIYRVKQCEQRP
jgi:transposase InsO family protein